MSLVETSRFQSNADNLKSDRTHREAREWLRMDVRWLVTEETIESQGTVAGRAILPPGIGGKHALHRRPNARKWEYVIFGTVIKHVGDGSLVARAGEIAFIPESVYHDLANASVNEGVLNTTNSVDQGRQDWREHSSAMQRSSR